MKFNNTLLLLTLLTTASGAFLSHSNNVQRNSCFRVRENTELHAIGVLARKAKELDLRKMLESGMFVCLFRSGFGLCQCHSFNTSFSVIYDCAFGICIDEFVFYT